MTELLIALALFAMVLALVGLPLITAFGYIEKAIAHNEAQNAGRKTLRQLTTELANAEYVFPVPADGSWVTFVPPAGANAAISAISTSFVTGSATNISLVRYAQVLDYPWAGSLLLQPNYANTAPSGVFPCYDNYHSSFYANSGPGMTITLNPYILARFSQTMSWASATNDSYFTPLANYPVPWAAAMNISVDGSYPMDTPTYTSVATVPNSASVLKRFFRNDMVAASPLGAQWDVPRFQVTPLRVATESLTMQVDGSGNPHPTLVTARYPLWAGCNADIYQAAQLPIASIYHSTIADITDPSGAIRMNNANPLYPLWDVLDAKLPRGNNPFGYQIEVVDNTGHLVCGLLSSTNPIYNRHYMDWPPIDRPDFITNGVFDPAKVLWTTADIAAQRSKGQVVFEQPMSTASVTVGTDPIFTYAGNPNFAAFLPIPGGSWFPGGNWVDASAYCVQLPRKIIANVNGTPCTFKFVDKNPANLYHDECCCPFQLPGIGDFRRNAYMLSWNSPLTPPTPPPSQPSLPSGSYSYRYARYVVFGSDMSSVPTGSTIATNPLNYTICDLQPTDTVVATYSTLGVLDVGFTLSRQDRSGGDPAQSRQDATFNSHIEVRNALRRAQGF